MNEEIILLTKKDCQKCDWVKEKMNDVEKDAVRVMNAETVDGMVIRAYHEIFEEAEMPILIVSKDENSDPEIIKGSIKISKKINELVGHKQS